MIYFILIVLFILTFLKLAWNYGNYPKNILSTMSIPIIPNAYPFIGNVLSYLDSKNIGEADMKNLKEYGDVYGLCEFHNPVIVVKDLTILKEVLIKQFHYFTDRREINLRGWMKYSLLDQQGEDWKRIRSLLTPFFSTLKLKNCLPAIQDCTQVYLKNIEHLRLKDSSVNISRTSSSLTFDILLSTAFSIQVDSQNDSQNPILNVLKQITNLDFAKPTIMISNALPFLCPVMEFFGITMWPSGYLKYFENVAHELISQRKNDTKKYNDFLDVLVKCDENLKDGHSEKGLKLNQKEIYAQMLIFFLAGFDTTSKTLAFLLYLISVNDDKQVKLLKEIERCLGNEEPDYDNINKVDYLEAVISETLRQYPPVYRFDRIASDDVNVGGGLLIKKGVSVAVPVWAIHYDPDLWPEPETFNPERFLGDKKDHDPCSFLPFGLGLRSCIGVRFAHLVLKIIVVQLLRKFRFSKSDKTKVPMELLASGFFVQPMMEIFLKVEPR